MYRLLPQTTPENLQKNFHLFTIDPVTRYVNVNRLLVPTAQVYTDTHTHHAHKQSLCIVMSTTGETPGRHRRKVGI